MLPASAAHMHCLPTASSPAPFWALLAVPLWQPPPACPPARRAHQPLPPPPRARSPPCSLDLAGLKLAGPISTSLSDLDGLTSVSWFGQGWARAGVPRLPCCIWECLRRPCARGYALLQLHQRPQASGSCSSAAVAALQGRGLTHGPSPLLSCIHPPPAAEPIQQRVEGRRAAAAAAPPLGLAAARQPAVGVAAGADWPARHFKRHAVQQPADRQGCLPACHSQCSSCLWAAGALGECRVGPQQLGTWLAPLP